MKFKHYLMVLIILLIGAAAWVYIWLLRSHPIMAGTYYLPQLSAPVEVIRDNFGVPHIKAQNKKDGFFILGYLMSSDRLFQLDIYRRLAKGELSEIFGASTLDLDLRSRVFQIKNFAIKQESENYHAYGEEFWELTNSFFSGINTYIDQVPLSYEFTLLGYRPKKFDASDAFAVYAYMALGLSVAMNKDILFSNLKNTIKDDQLLEQLKISPATDVVGQYQTQKLVKFLARVLNDPNPFAAEFSGSNAWAVAGARSSTGRPILANDPHLTYSLPSIWYDAHLITPNHQLYGHYLPGIPFPILGHNQNYAWGFTMSMADDMDFYLELFNDQKTQVMYQNQWEKFQVVKEVIKVAKQENVVVKIPITRHGPIINAWPKLFWKPGPIAVKWALHHPDNFSLRAIYQLGEAQNMTDFRSALQFGAAPGLNITYADQQGNIAQYLFGKIPKRSTTQSSQEILKGWDGKDEYLGYYLFEELPQIENPVDGIVVSANSRPVSDNPDHQNIRGFWRPPDRYQSIRERLLSRDKWDVAGMMELQNYQWSNNNLPITKKLLAFLDVGQLPALSLEAQAYKTLANWDGITGAEAIAPALYYNWYHIIIRTLTSSFTPDQQAIYCSLPDSWEFFQRMLEPSSANQKEYIAKVVIESFRAMVMLLVKNYGPTFDSWRWGKMNQLFFPHILHQYPILGSILTIGPLGVGGGNEQINLAAAYRCDNQFLVTSGASLRVIIDLGSPEKSFGVLPLGQSGHVLSPHYRDQLALYTSGKYKEQLLNWEQLPTNEYHQILFRPDK